jgi:hypothetical protein
MTPMMDELCLTGEALESVTVTFQGEPKGEHASLASNPCLAKSHFSFNCLASICYTRFKVHMPFAHHYLSTKWMLADG